jgi:SOS-response transcriptional repressor LexA
MEQEKKKKKMISKQQILNTTNASPLVCNICSRNDFTSRNSLFKHIKICSVANNSTNDKTNIITSSSTSSSSSSDEPNLVFIEVEEILKNQPDKDIYIYVTGGRIRGRTLGR